MKNVYSYPLTQPALCKEPDVQTQNGTGLETENQIQNMIVDFNNRLRQLEEKIVISKLMKGGWLTHRHICKMLNISKRTLDLYREKGYLPYSKIGGTVYYRATDVENYLVNHLVIREGTKKS
ncbi:MAG: helix-turn-helix domain-containing protein [Bacteroidales bacterium]|nr:helix-turn-helix domain-containing protein [Bacteroidales bacterium]